MSFDRVGAGLAGVLASSAVAVAASITLAVVLRSPVEHAPRRAPSPGASPVTAVDFPSEIPAKREMFNKGLPLKVDDYTVLQRVDHKAGRWNFHFVVSYYITKVKEFEDKKHATAISSLCMDKSFVRELKESGPFLYEYLDPSGQAADVTIPKDDCGE